MGIEEMNLNADDVMLLEFCCGLRSEATDNLWETMQDYASKEGMYWVFTEIK
jgi:hypothetical protein